MAYLQPPGQLVVRVTCRRCGRSVELDPKRVPIKSDNRLRCIHCGNRGATVQRIWDTRKPPGNVVPIKRR